jgi:hypothetical protein
MNQQGFFRALDEVDDAFFIWNGLLRTRVHGNKESVDPIIAVARSRGYKGNDLSEAIHYLNLDIEFAMKIIEISEGKGVYTPTDLKIQAKLMNRTVKKFIH